MFAEEGRSVGEVPLEKVRRRRGLLERGKENMEKT